MNAIVDSEDHASLREWMRQVDAHTAGRFVDARFCREILLNAPVEAVLYLRARLREVMPTNAPKPHPDTRGSMVREESI